MDFRKTEVVERWTQIYKSDVLVDQWLLDPDKGIFECVFWLFIYARLLP